MTFPWPETGMPIENIPTPMPVIDEDRLASNIARAQAYLNQHGKNFRPHIKTHKIPSIARQQRAAGAKGINCQKLSEAEVFADAGFEDILITYNIFGSDKLDRLKRLNCRIDRLKVTVDSEAVLEGLARVFEAARPMSVLVECDTGGKRCGVQTPDAAVKLAGTISAAPGLTFAGIVTYPAIGGAHEVEKFLSETVDRLAKRAIACPIRSNGGTPDLYSAHLVPTATEHRAGTYVYNDRSLLRAGHCTQDALAMHILATVVSRPTPGRAILDCGSKTLTSDLLGFQDYGLIDGHEQARLVGLSEEHAVVELSPDRQEFPSIGSVVRVIPNHACVVSNLFDRMVFHRNGIVTRIERVAARGMVW